jgi:hypothetical protein
MTSNILTPVINCMQDVYKDNVLCIEEDKIVVKNNLNYDDIKALQRIFGEEKKIILQERDNSCPICGRKMVLDGLGHRTINKNNKIYVQKYECEGNHPYKYHRTDLTHFVSKNSNFTYEVVLFNLKMSIISYCSLEKRSEQIYEVHECKPSRRTVYCHTEKEKDNFLKLHKVIISKEEYSGIYGYDEQFPNVNGIERMRMTIIDIETRIIVSEGITEDFSKETKEKFIKESLKGLPLKGMVTDGDKSYMSIIDDLGIPHKSCTFHIMQNLMKSAGKQLKKLERRDKNIKS